MAFKQDEDFLRFITMGAAGSAAVSRHLREAHGHRTIELERYAMANKIWATKIKRLRLADLVCLNCGRRIEARSKSDLKVRMSHSNTAGREWDAGLRDNDLCAFVPWANGGVAGPPEYFTVGAMRGASGLARFGPPKAASEGAERDMTWPVRLATRDSVVEQVNLFSGKVMLRPYDGRRQTVSLPDGIPMFIYVSEGDMVRGGCTFVMGCLDRPELMSCPGGTWSIASDLADADPSTRYAAVKGAGVRGDATLEAELVFIAQDQGEDDRIRLEAWASLSRLDPARYTRHVVAQANERRTGERHAMAMAMEAIFILAEMQTEEAADALTALAADDRLDSEARSAAVWGLGVAGVNDTARVLAFIADPDEDVALHALAGIGHLPSSLLGRAADVLGMGDVEGASAGALLARQGANGAQTLLRAATSKGPGSLWARAALGEMDEAEIRPVAGGVLPNELTQVLEPMWAARGSWLRRQEQDTPLGFLERQTTAISAERRPGAEDMLRETLARCVDHYGRPPMIAESVGGASANWSSLPLRATRTCTCRVAPRTASAGRGRAAALRAAALRLHARAGRRTPRAVLGCSHAGIDASARMGGLAPCGHRVRFEALDLAVGARRARGLYLADLRSLIAGTAPPGPTSTRAAYRRPGTATRPRSAAATSSARCATS